jgi:hypothetical protein
MRSLLLVSSVIAFFGSLAVAAEPTELLGKFPGDFNSVAIVRVKEALATKRAQTEGWGGDKSSDFLAGVVPPWVDQLVRVSHIHPGQDTDGQWAAALIESEQGLSIDTVAETEKTTPQLLRGKRVVRTGRGSYFVSFSKNLLGVLIPGHRQDVAWWIEQYDADVRRPATGYLDTALKSIGGHIVLALDCRDLFEPEFIRYRVAGAKSMQGKSPTDVEALRRIFLGLQGVRSQITISESIQWEVALDFDQPVGSEASLVHEIFREFVDDLGASIDELSGALVSTESNSVVLRAELSDMSLRRIMTLITSPRPGQDQQPRKNPDRDYFRDLEKIVMDLQNGMRKSKDPGKMASWCDNYAKKIENSSTRGVDPLLVKYGADLASRLRALGASLRGVQLKVNTLQNSVVWNTTVTPGHINAGWWGDVGYQPSVYNTTSNLQEVRQKQADAVMAGAADRDAVWSMIDADRDSLRTKLRSKYGAEIDSWK